MTTTTPMPAVGKLLRSLRRSLLLGAAVTLAAGCAAAPAPARADAVRGTAAVVVQVADGVFMVQGASGEVDTDNLGRIGNAGFIVGPGGVMAIDTGTSYRHGRELLAAIGSVTDKPVRLALITHTRQEFLFGAAAFRERGIPIHMHRAAAGLMTSRCERCLKTLNQVLGAEAMAGTAMFRPDHEFTQSHLVELIGRPVEVLYFGHSSGPGDVAVLERRTRTLFAGGLLDHQRIPDVQDADLDGWARALRNLRELRPAAVVPGHGPPASTAAIATVDTYLTQLQARVLELLRSGTALSDVADAAALPEFAGWDQYDTIHRRNASVLFVRFEREQMFRQADSKE